MKFLHIAVAAALSTGIASANPISFVDIFRSAVFNQTSNAQPGAPTFYFFSADVNVQNASDFNGATLTGPVGGPHPLSILGLFNPLAFNYSSNTFSTLAAFNAAFPNGTYSFAVTGPGSNPDAPANLTETRPAADQFGTVTPFLTNFSALQNLNALTSLAVNWNSFTGALASPNDALIFFNVYRVSDGVNVFGSNFQASGATSATIGANTLAPNTAYTFELDFSNRLIIANNASGNSIFGPEFGYDLRTGGTFTTAPAATPEPLTGVLVLAGLGFLAMQRPRQALKS